MDIVKLLVKDPVIFCVVDLEPTVGRNALRRLEAKFG